MPGEGSLDLRRTAVQIFEVRSSVLVFFFLEAPLKLRLTTAKTAVSWHIYVLFRTAPTRVLGDELFGISLFFYIRSSTYSSSTYIPGGAVLTACMSG